MLPFVEPHRRQNSASASGGKSRRSIRAHGERAACDRCRGQKLRCIWEGAQSCRRCSRAKADCISSPSRPMGRPPCHPSISDSSLDGREDGSDAYYEDTNMTMPGPDGTPVHLTATSSRSVPSRLSALSSEESCRMVPMPAGSSMSTSASPLNHQTSFSSQDSASQADLWDFLDNFPDAAMNEFPSPTSLNIPSNLGFTVPINRDFAPPKCNEPTATAPLASDRVAGSRTGKSHLDTTLSSTMTPPDWPDGVNLIKQMCDLHMALFKHPLNMNGCDQRRSGAARGHDTPESASTDSRQASAEGGAGFIPDFSVADLELGRVFALTVQLKGLTGQIPSLDSVRSAYLNGSARDHQGRVQSNPTTATTTTEDRATAMLALSCYARLESIYAHAIDALLELQNNGRYLHDSYRLMPDLIVDGFSLGGCQDFQLRLVTSLCKQALEKIRTNMR